MKHAFSVPVQGIYVDPEQDAGCVPVYRPCMHPLYDIKTLRGSNYLNEPVLHFGFCIVLGKLCYASWVSAL